MASGYRERQIAMRRLLLDQRGQLNRDARVLAVELRKLCGPSAGVAFSNITVYDRDGRVDPIATAQAATRREIWDHFVRLLHLEPFEAANLREGDE